MLERDAIEMNVMISRDNSNSLTVASEECSSETDVGGSTVCTIVVPFFGIYLNISCLYWWIKGIFHNAISIRVALKCSL